VMRRFVISVLAILLLIGMAAPACAQDSDGTITGRVVNDTRGGSVIEGVLVTLLTYIDNALADTMTVKTDSEGGFRFDGINPGHFYIVTARYLEVDYYYQVQFASGATAAYIEAGVCDTTDSDELIRVEVNHKVIEIKEASLKVTEVLWLVNDGDRTYVGSGGVLDFRLPEGAYGFEAPQDFIMDFQLLDGNIVSYLVPFPPGGRELIYSYRLPRPGTDEFVIPLVIDYPTDGVEVLVAGEGIEVSAGQLAPADPVVTEAGERLLHFHGEDFPRNTTIDLGISGLSGGGGFPLYVIWIILAAVVAGMVVFLVVRKRRRGINE
jgi:hypothetical protein